MSEFYKVQYSFTRPNDTTAYAANDLVANSTTAGSVEPIALNIGHGGFKVHTYSIEKSGTGVANATFNLYLYCGPKPTTTAGDNAAWTRAATPKEGFFETVASSSLGTMSAHTDGALTYSEGWGPYSIGYATHGHLWMFMTAGGAYTPEANEVFTITVYIEKV
jgi:hypothetical protein